MPDEDTPTAVADTEVAPAPPAGTEVEATDVQLTDLDTEGEVGVQPEQEAQDKEPEQEAGQETKPSFSEALEAAKPLLEGLKESDPEQYNQLTKLFGGDDVDARSASLEQREAGLLAAASSQSAFADVTKVYATEQQDVQKSVVSFGDAVSQTINKPILEAGGQPVSSGPRVAAQVQKYVEKAENTGRAIGAADSFLEARTAALMSPMGAKLTAEELNEIGGLTWQDAVTHPRETYGKLFDTMLKAAVRAAPEAAVKEGVAKSEQAAKAAAILENLTKTLPKNGKAQVAVGTNPSTKRYLDMTSTEREKLTDTQRDTIISRDARG